jgi:hypothetical protein
MDFNPMYDPLIFLDTLSRMIPEEKVSPQLKELVEAEIKTWCLSSDISPNIIKLITRLWREHPQGRFPTLDDLVAYFNVHSCLCIRVYSQEERRALNAHFLTHLGRLPTCIETDTAMEFYRLEHRLPAPEELETTLQRTLRLMTNPESFHATDRLHIPVPNLAHLKAVPLEDSKEALTCALCLEDLKIGQNCYRLSCSHVFHSDPTQCLDESSILEWFGSHRQCPVCRKEIIIEKPA